MQTSAFHSCLVAASLFAIATSPAAAQDPQVPLAPEVAVPVAEVEPAAEWTHWTSGRYRITPGDVIEISFPFVPELNQTATVQPDGYVTLKDVDDLRVQGRTASQVEETLRAAYASFVRDPIVNVTLQEFERPYFVAGGEVTRPGRYELRGATTLTQALAVAGGPVRGANTSKVVLYRRLHDNQLEVKEIDVAGMLADRDLSEDPLLRPGDTIVVPRGVLGKMMPLLNVLRLW